MARSLLMTISACVGRVDGELEFLLACGEMADGFVADKGVPVLDCCPYYI